VVGVSSFSCFLLFFGPDFTLNFNVIIRNLVALPIEFPPLTISLLLPLLLHWSASSRERMMATSPLAPFRFFYLSVTKPEPRLSIEIAGLFTRRIPTVARASLVWRNRFSVFRHVHIQYKGGRAGCSGAEISLFFLIT